MKRFVSAFTILAALALVMPAHAEKIKIRLAHGASHTHPFNKLAEMWKEAVEKRTDKVDIQIFGDRQLGGDKQVLEGAIAGTIDAAFPSSILFPLVLKDQKVFDALQLPFVVNSYENLATMLTSKPAMQMLVGLKRDGLVGLSFGEAGLRHFLNRKGPVQYLRDFKGLKTRIVPVPLHKAVWKAVGANPVGIAYGEVYTSMQTHVIDAVEFNISSIETENLWEVAKYLTLTGHYFWPGVLVYNKAKFEKLPKDVQQAMIEAGREIIKPQVMFVKKHEEEAAKRLEAKGVKIYPFKDLKKMQALMKPIVKQWEKKDPLIAEYVAEAKKLEKGN